MEPPYGFSNEQYSKPVPALHMYFFLFAIKCLCYCSRGSLCFHGIKVILLSKLIFHYYDTTISYSTYANSLLIANDIFKWLMLIL